LSRYIVVSRVTKRPIFEFVSSAIHPGDALIAFAFEDDYSFGVLQSIFHWEWFKAKCSTLKGDFRYTGDTVFDTFVWPQKPNEDQIRAVANIDVELRNLRGQILVENEWGLKQLYSSLETPGENPLRDVHQRLDLAVADAYGFQGGDVLGFLLDYNLSAASVELSKKVIVWPGLPTLIKNREDFVSDDCIKV